MRTYRWGEDTNTSVLEETLTPAERNFGARGILHPEGSDAPSCIEFAESRALRQTPHMSLRPTTTR